MKRIIVLLAATALLSIGAAACHDTGNPPGSNPAIKAGDGLAITAPGIGGTVCAIEWNEWQETDGSAQAGWRATNNNPANTAGCASVQVCMAYTWGDPIQSNLACTEVQNFPSGSIGQALGIPNVTARDAVLIVVSTGAFVEYRCSIHVAANNVGPLCPAVIPA